MKDVGSGPLPLEDSDLQSTRRTPCPCWRSKTLATRQWFCRS